MITSMTCYVAACDKCGQVVPVNRDYLTSFDDDDRDTEYFTAEAAALAALGNVLAGVQLADGALPGWPAGTILDAKCLAGELCRFHGCDWEPWNACCCTVDPTTGELQPPGRADHAAGCTDLRMCRRPFCGAVQQRTPDGVESLLEVSV